MLNSVRVSQLLLSAPALLIFILAESASAAPVLFNWVAVGDTDNSCDDQSQGCFGAVPYIYRISKTEVTNAQYAAFLNAKAAADPNALYDPKMASELNQGGIIQSGVSGGFVYTTIAGREKMPVNWVSF